MAIFTPCIPKHILCGWYAPTFTASPEGCQLSIVTERKSRLPEGGTFFRSINVGLQTNSIQVQCVWQMEDGSPLTLDPANWRDYNSTSDSIYDMVGIKVTVTDGTITEPDYYSVQQYDADTLTWSSGIPDMRIELSASNLIRMPDIDWDAQSEPFSGTPPWDKTTGDAEYMTEFTSFVSLTGGTGADSSQPGLDAIRTGPAYTLIYVDLSEALNIEGKLLALGATRYWNGFCWKSSDPVNPNCGDPNIPCSGGPASDCP